jgi:hypothetical protein
MKQITNPNMLAIASGQTDHPDEMVRVYRQEWQKQGYELPDWEPTGKPMGTVKRKGCGCAKRKAAMNRVIPGSGDLLEKGLSAIGIRAIE